MKKKPPTQDELRAKIKRCPLWMQEIALQALDERDEVQRKLDAKIEAQKPTPFFTEDFEMVGGRSKRRRTYFECDGEMVVVHNGIRIEIELRGNNMRDGKGIYVRFSADEEGLGRAGVCLVPRDYHAIEFRKPEDVR